jgi:hypothetical protein
MPATIYTGEEVRLGFMAFNDGFDKEYVPDKMPTEVLAIARIDKRAALEAAFIAMGAVPRFSTYSGTVPTGEVRPTAPYVVTIDKAAAKIQIKREEFWATECAVKMQELGAMLGQAASLWVPEMIMAASADAENLPAFNGKNLIATDQLMGSNKLTSLSTLSDYGSTTVGKPGAAMAADLAQVQAAMMKFVDPRGQKMYGLKANTIELPPGTEILNAFHTLLGAEFQQSYRWKEILDNAIENPFLDEGKFRLHNTKRRMKTLAVVEERGIDLRFKDDPDSEYVEFIGRGYATAAAGDPFCVAQITVPSAS